MKLNASLLLWCLSLSVLHPALGGSAINTEDFASGTISMSELASSATSAKQNLKKQKREAKDLQRTEKLMSRIEKAFQSKMQKKSLSGISDPVDKWFWIWSISWGAGILITIFAGGAVAATAIGIVWLFAFALGSVSLIIWLIKKFG